MHPDARSAMHMYAGICAVLPRTVCKHVYALVCVWSHCIYVHTVCNSWPWQDGRWRDGTFCFTSSTPVLFLAEDSDSVRLYLVSCFIFDSWPNGETVVHRLIPARLNERIVQHAFIPARLFIMSWFLAEEQIIGYHSLTCFFFLPVSTNWCTYVGEYD